MKNRILTAAVGVPFAIMCMFLTNTIVFNIVVALITLIIISELLTAGKCWNFKFASITCMVFAGAMPILSIPKISELRFLFGLLFVFVLFLCYIKQNKLLAFNKLCYMITSTCLVSFAMSCMVLLVNLDKVHGVCYVILSMALPWMSDAGAYFIGTAFGKHKLCPTISPKKSVEGAVGGIVVTVIFACVYCIGYKYVQGRWFGNDFSVNYFIVAAVAITSAVLAIVGDMAASLLKRQCEIKDYGSLMPGHGGMLDRFDSVLFVLPFLTELVFYKVGMFS